MLHATVYMLLTVLHGHKSTTCAIMFFGYLIFFLFLCRYHPVPEYVFNATFFRFPLLIGCLLEFPVNILRLVLKFLRPKPEKAASESMTVTLVKLDTTLINTNSNKAYCRYM